MMVAHDGPLLDLDADEEYTDSEFIEEEEYSDEAGEEYGHNEVYVPRTYEDFQTLFKNQFDPTPDDELSEEPVSSPSDEPQSVDLEMEKKVENAFKMSDRNIAIESPEPETSPDGPLSQEDDYEPEEAEDITGK